MSTQHNQCAWQLRVCSKETLLFLQSLHLQPKNLINPRLTEKKAARVKENKEEFTTLLLVAIPSNIKYFNAESLCPRFINESATSVTKSI